MSKLEHLIAELCPNGVEYKPLSEIATVTRGGNFQKKDFCQHGMPCIHYGQIYTQYGLFIESTNQFISSICAKKQKLALKNDIIMAVTSENIEDVCKCLAWLGEGAVAVSGHTAIIHHNQNAKYLVYYFHTGMFFAQKRKLAHGTKVIEVTPNKLNEIIVPVPPLDVQDEIVRILDNFTELTAELTTELTTELSARKKQYEYYRDSLLTFGDNVEWKPLGEVATTISSGKNREKNNTGRYPVYGSTGIIAYTDNFKYNGEQILVARVGANAGFVHKANGYYDVSDNTIIVSISSKYELQYIFYLLQNLNLNSMAKGGGQPLVTAGEIKKIRIPVPPLPEQQRIVKILDRFNKLCNDIIEGLPAEIKARQQQYEYYRDKLLTFKEKEI